MRRGLVVIYDFHSIQQFVWYCRTYANKVKRDASCLHNGYKGTYMTEYYKKAGIFSEIIYDETDYLSMSPLEKMKLF